MIFSGVLGIKVQYSAMKSTKGGEKLVQGT